MVEPRELVSLHQVASGPEPDALGYSDYAMYDLGQAVAQLGVQAASLGLAAHQFAGLDHDGVATGVRRCRRTGGSRPASPSGGSCPPDEAADDLVRERDRRPRTRKPLSELAFGGRFGEPLGLSG